MENMEKSGNVETAEISFALIYAFLRKNFKKILWVGGCSFVLAMLVILAVYCFVPRSSGYQLTLAMTLPSKGGFFCYPNEKKFSSADMISRPVLRKVYSDLGLEKQVEFEDFANSFYVARTNMKKAFIDAQFKARMNVRNINAVQLAQLEREYQEALAAVKSSQMTIVMEPKFNVNKTLAARIMNAIPEAWFDIYSVQEAALYPATVPVQQIQNLTKSIGQESQLILLERTKLFCVQLKKLCLFLDEMLQGRNLTLASGEMLADLLPRLNVVEQYQVDVLLQYVLEHPELCTPFDRMFLESRAQGVAFELTRVNGKYDGVLAAQEALLTDSAARSGASGSGKAVAGGNGNAPVSLSFDAGFFSSVNQLIRKDINNELRRTIARSLITYGEERAELQAEYDRYKGILEILNGKTNVKATSKLTRDRFLGMIREMVREIYTISVKANEFRDLILQQEHTSRQFYSRDTNVHAFSAPVISLKRVVLGIIAVWALLNAGYVFFLFQFRKEN